MPVLNIRDFGAVPDGKTLCTAAVQRAIDACGQAGGGTVYVPPGTFLTGTLLLRSNVTLYLEAGATLLGSARIEDYGPQHVLYAKGAQNIGLAGPGTIDGQGHAFCSDSNITAYRASCASSITGIPGHLVRNVTVTNLRVTSIGGGTLDLAGRELPENESNYPEATGWGQMPCHGLFVRHVTGLLLRDLRFFTDQPDARPALICHDTADLRVDGLELDGEVTADWLIELRDVREAVFRNTNPPRGTRTWVRVAGAKCKGILLLPDALRDVQKPVELSDGVPAEAVLLRPVHQ